MWWGWQPRQPPDADVDELRVAKGPAGHHRGVAADGDGTSFSSLSYIYVWRLSPRTNRLTLQGVLGPHDVWAHTIISALKIGTDRGNFQGPAEGADHFPGAPGYPRYVGDSNCALIKAVGSEVRAGAPRRRRVLRHSGWGALE